VFTYKISLQNLV